MSEVLLDDLFWRALLAGAGLVVMTGPLGCFIVWRRMAYFGDTLAHSALLGVALGVLMGVNFMIPVLGVALVVALVLVALQSRGLYSADTVLGILSHSALALGLVVLAVMDDVRVDLMATLFGDILAVGLGDLMLIYGGAVLVLVLVVFLWRPLLALSVNAELAQADGVRALPVQIGFSLLIAVVVALAMKLVGILLVTALLVIPAASARVISSSPEQMAVYAGIAGLVAVSGGLKIAFLFDLPAGPAIIVAAGLLFCLSLVAGRVLAVGR